MYWYDYFRNEDSENDLFCCPPGEFPLNSPSYFEFMSRQQQPIGGAPYGPPPDIIPSKQQGQMQFMPGTHTVNPNSLRPCRFRYVYIWPRRGRPFWAWLTYVGRRSASGFRWNGFRWLQFGIDLRQIESFICY